MYLTALTQRDRLFDVATRWLNGETEPDDVRFISEVFLLERAITNPPMVEFLKDVTAPFDLGSFRLRHLRTKDEVRRTIVSGWNDPTDHAQRLFHIYSEHSSDFFPGTPVDMTAVIDDSGSLLAMVRFKQLVRIADKVARKTINQLVGARLGQAVSVSNPVLDKSELRVDDLIGAKLVVSEHQKTQVEAAIAAHPAVLSVQRREHHGVYNDLKLVVNLRTPPPGPVISRLLGLDWNQSLQRGVDPGQLLRDIPGYVESNADSFTLEIIMTGWEDLVESEFGRGLHEERIVRQRADPLYNNQLATNIGLVITYLLIVAVSPATEVSTLPVTMNGRHLPDAVFGNAAMLFGLDLDRSPLWNDQVA